MDSNIDSTASLFGWMAWTTPVAVFFCAVLLMLVGMTLWQIRSPSIERKGFLPIPTTRGDRLFIGLLSAAYINLAWAGLTDMEQAIGAGISFVVLLVMMRWG
jgi:predicted small integral membrane protein